MFNRKLTWMLGVVLGAGGLCMLAGRSSRAEERPGPAAGQAPTAPAPLRMLADEPVAIADGDTELRKLLKTRYNTALQMLKVVNYQYSRGLQQASDLIKPARRVTEAELELSDDPQHKVAALEKLLEVAAMVERVQADMWKAGRVSESGSLEARYEQLSVEIRLLRAREAAAR